MCEIFINTVEFRFSIDAPRPSWIEIAEFVKQIHADVLDVETVYKLTENRSICIKYKSESAMLEALRKNSEPQHFKYASGNSVQVSMVVAGRNIEYVRVFDLPPEISDDDLLLAFQPYGKVERVDREKFPGNLGLDHVYNGVRGVHIEVENEIPSMISIRNRKAKVFYDGLKDKCFLCQSRGHRMNSCPKRKNTYAAIAKAAETVSLVEDLNATVDEIEEVIEEEVLEEPPELEKELTGKKQRVDKQKPEIDDDYIQRTYGIPNATQLVNNFNAVMEEQKKKLVASQRRAQFASSGSVDPAPPRKSSRKGNR